MQDFSKSKLHKIKIEAQEDRGVSESSLTIDSLRGRTAAELMEVLTGKNSDPFRDLMVEAVEIVKLPNSPISIYVCGGFKGAPLRCECDDLQEGLLATITELAEIAQEERLKKNLTVIFDSHNEQGD